MKTPSVAITPQIERAMDQGAALAISISGGKDSQAMAIALADLHRARGWKGECFLITADLGRIEWPETAAQIQRIADMTGLRLVTVRRSDGQDMIDHWVARGRRMQAQGKQARPWSDAGNRFCTSDMKRDPIDIYLRRYSAVVVAMGIRAQESTARSKKPISRVRPKLSCQSRLALDWNPILHWSLTDVLAACGHTWWDMRQRQLLAGSGKTEQALLGWSLHPAYVFGNERLSCQFCILASENDLANGAAHRPDVLADLISIEDEFGFTFQNGKSLRRFQAQEEKAA